ncbi:hypothetical protein [Azospirillum sp. ST 5-10]|uniref:hypothetical protein n=1 Tax=unclassified Azospirillum TaxID=2630922 RepID=UPI003F49F72F
MADTALNDAVRSGRAWTYALLAAVALVLTGCSAIASLWSSGIATESVAFEVAPDANANSAVAVDLVFVHDETLLPTVGELTAATWFKNRGQLTLAQPTGLQVQSFEFMPGQSVPPHAVRGRASDARAAFVFAGYGGDGPHRARIDGIEKVLLRLGAKDFEVATPHAS